MKRQFGLHPLLINYHSSANAGTDTSQIVFIPTGIRQLTTETLHLQPNPAHSSVAVSAGSVIRELSMTDVTGEEVLKNAAINSYNVTIDISTLANGLYFVQVITENGAGIAKLVVAR